MASKWDKYADEWIELYRNGATYDDISKKYSVDYKTIGKQIAHVTKQIRAERKQKLADKLVELANNHDLSYKDIGSVIGVSNSNICNLIKENKIPRSVRMKMKYGHAWARLYNDGYSLKDICDMFKIDRKVVSDAIKELGENVQATPREKYTALVPIWNRMYEFGFSQKEIEEIFGIPQGVIKRYLKQYCDFKRGRSEKRSPEQVKAIREFINLITGSEANGKDS